MTQKFTKNGSYMIHPLPIADYITLENCLHSGLSKSIFKDTIYYCTV